MNKYLFCLFAALCVAHRKTHFYTLLYTAAAAVIYSAEMNKHFAAIFGQNKTEALVRVKPFYFALFLVFRPRLVFLVFFCAGFLWFLLLLSSSALGEFIPGQ